MSNFPSDIEIAQSATLQPIRVIAEKINITEDDLEYYGKYKAKLPLELQVESPKGKLILVSAMSPTKYGEGKTTMSIGLTDGLNFIGKKWRILICILLEIFLPLKKQIIYCLQ